MKHFSWILTLPLTIAIVVFSVNNITSMPIDLWPFGIIVEWPTYLVVLLAVVIGFACGAVAMWFSAGRSRREARRQRTEVQRLSRELESLRRATETARTADRMAVPATPKLPATVSD